MSSFERVKSGIPSLDKTLDNIRLGDNVVWQVSNLKEFSYFVDPFVREAVRENKNIIYVHFGQNKPLIDLTEEDYKNLNKEKENPDNEFSMIYKDGIKIYEVNPDNLFESFTLEVHKIIEKEGKGAYFVFDSLSELQSAWSTDLMMGNFFKVTCPYLFTLDTVAYFPLIRGKHSFDAIAKISETTQLFLDIYSKDDYLFIHPLKVWNRYSQNMFLGHKYEPKTGKLKALTDGLEVSEFYRVINDASAYHNEQNTDSWERFFEKTMLEYQNGKDIQDKCDQMCYMLMTKQEDMAEKVKEYFSAEDYFSVYDRVVGSGMIGGKACGMLLARKIIEHDKPEIYRGFEPDDSFYIGSDLFYTYIVSNDLWDIRVQQRTKEGYYSAGRELEEGLKNGEFTDDIKEKFKRILDYFGQSPIIVRSSSFLEDGYGNAFAGKYESIFCVNRGPIEQRLEEFENAVKRVYSSTMNISALEYRKLKHLDDKDEQMALLVQRVSGSYYGDYFFPTAAGVGFSYSPYLPLEERSTNNGMLRLVMGLGTKAVDRTQKDYPRIVNVNRPRAQTQPNVAKRHEFSQHYLDLLNLKKIQIDELDVEDGLKIVPRYAKQALVEHDTEAERLYSDRGQHREIIFVNCNGLVNNSRFINLMKEVLSTLQKAYDYPVDIEYTVNVGENHSFVVNLLQCRPLQVSKSDEKIEIPKVTDNVYFHFKDSSMGRSRKEDIDTLVYVHPYYYYHYPYSEKPKIRNVIGKINKYCRENNRNSMLIVPGRLGTSSPELGIPAVFADISNFSVILEESYSQAGYEPELSLGSHMFQDLVETDIYYGALFEDENRLEFNRDLFKDYPNQLNKIDDELDEDIYEMIHVYEFENKNLKFYYDLEQDETLCYLDK
ncbi:PEP/pyruvate-binding domain-containing protein [Methanobrevibacter sp. AbM4]|uniref:PEP/pyruvate-binding domain-containing protein n=1 Tax=Methanobrevibacter sp. AbM4 TaxID=224719 RepID=UPI0003348BDB|nr:PEP/pyruvate-binding domain-containing protein [Methanobrevibacter sp. AbM4]AGN16754.1 phosphoenolpyruvate synthase/pyruvate phosphate dikinase [Methanobrevibacter sp. AbM4]